MGGLNEDGMKDVKDRVESAILSAVFAPSESDEEEVAANAEAMRHSLPVCPDEDVTIDESDDAVADGDREDEEEKNAPKGEDEKEEEKEKEKEEEDGEEEEGDGQGEDIQTEGRDTGTPRKPPVVRGIDSSPKKYQVFRSNLRYHRFDVPTIIGLRPRSRTAVFIPFCSLCREDRDEQLLHIYCDRCIDSKVTYYHETCYRKIPNIQRASLVTEDLSDNEVTRAECPQCVALEVVTKNVVEKTNWSRTCPVCTEEVATGDNWGEVTCQYGASHNRIHKHCRPQKAKGNTISECRLCIAQRAEQGNRGMRRKRVAGGEKAVEPTEKEKGKQKEKEKKEEEKEGDPKGKRPKRWNNRG
jgi:hypothetical protein